MRPGRVCGRACAPRVTAAVRAGSPAKGYAGKDGEAGQTSPARTEGGHIPPWRQRRRWIVGRARTRGDGRLQGQEGQVQSRVWTGRNRRTACVGAARGSPEIQPGATTWSRSSSSARMRPEGLGAGAERCAPHDPGSRAHEGPAVGAAPRGWTDGGAAPGPSA